MIHLHVHTPYSFLDGFGESKAYITRAIELGQPALAITDHGVLYGVYNHYKECMAADIKPILGCEFYVTPDHTIKDKNELKELPFDNCHLVLLAKNNVGLQNIYELASIAQLKGFYYKPRVDKELLAQYAEGVIALSACLAGEIPELIIRGDIDGAKQAIRAYKTIFEDFYLEVQANNIPEQALVNNVIYQLAEETYTPIVVTCDCHYVNQEDGLYHKHFVKLGDNKNDVWEQKWANIYSDAWMKSEQDILDAGIPQVAIDNTHVIADMCNVTIATDVFHMPEFTVPHGYTLASFLRSLAFNGLFTLSLEEDIDVEFYAKRLQYELEVITTKGYAGYFLIVRDILKKASELSPVGPGRGSAAGCLVSYLIGITKIDPIKHKLLFERFLNPDRPSLPDIDIDIDSDIRQDVINYICNKYGEDNVCQIVTFGTLASRLALKDAGHILGISFDTVNAITKEIPPPPSDGKKYTLEDAIREVPIIAEYAEAYPEMFELAIHFEGIPRQAGMHAAGLVIAPDKLTKFIPLARGKDNQVVSQFEKDTLEELGLLKVDLLALKTLSVIKQAITLIEENRGVIVNVDKIPLDDAMTLRLISSGATNGCFQLESPGMQKIFRDINNVTFDTLVAGVACYRPGPMAQIPKYISAANGFSEVEYIVPELEPILKDTYGIIVYQEQTMQIAVDLAGFTPGQSDLLRKAIGKKKVDVMERELDKLLNGSPVDNIPGMINKGIPRDKAEELIDMIKTFASYGFNKSHACSYAVLAFWTAYFKAHYPLEYMTALLNIYYDDKDICVKYLEEAKQLGIKILPPDVNRSAIGFSIIDESIIYGLRPIKGMGEGSSQLLLDSRPIVSLEQLASLPKLTINKKVLTSLSFSGALDNLCLDKSRLEIFKELIVELRKDKKAEMPVFNEKIKYNMEADLLKFVFSKHILDGKAKAINWSLLEFNKDLEVYCIISAIKVARQKNGKEMCYLVVDTLEGVRTLTVFSALYETIALELKKDLIIKATINKRLYKEKEGYIVKKIYVSKKYNKEG
jgi:DNA polymerase-3 subunit alpha